MKMVKSLILGSAAGLIAMSGAQAADLPVKAKAVEYVRICSLYGAGFYYIPGTDTCIKIGGYLRVETAFNTTSVYSGAYSSVAGAQNRLSNYYTARSREDLNIDTRTATEYGVVRTYWDATFSWTSGAYAGTGTGGTFYSAAAQAGGIGGVGNPSDGGTSGGSLGVYHAFIQFAGFTMGKTVSAFDAPWNNYPGNNFDGLVGGSGVVTGINQLTYTAQFGNGTSASIGVEDQTTYLQSNLYNVGAGFVSGPGFLGGGLGTNDRGGSRAPDIVGVLKVDQAWGLFQLSAAAHDNHAAYYGATEITGHPSDKWGWAVQGSLSIKNIPTGPGDVINVQAVYTDGASRYNFQNLAPQNFAMYGGSGLPGVYQSIGIAGISDGVFAPGTGISTVQTWGMRGAYTHNWDAYWNTAIYGAYAQAKYGNGGSALVCAAILGLGAAVVGGITNCNPDFNVAQLGLITRWTPVKNLTFSGEVTWTNLDQKFAGVIAAPQASGVAKPAALYELKDQNSVSFLARAQRNW
jgi:Porin subfamily